MTPFKTTWTYGIVVHIRDLSSGNADGDRDAETCEKTGERMPLWQEFRNRGFCTVRRIDFIDIRRLF